MAIIDFIEELKTKGIEISYSGGKLKYSGPEENVTSEMVENLKANKGALIKYLWPEELNILMPINPSGSKTPIFIVHGDNSNYIVSEYFGPDQPVFGFFHPGSDGKAIPYKTVEHMAAVYNEKIYAVCPSGPYYLIGYSFGGLLAFEMAVQLQKAGHKVPFLVLIDSICPLTKPRIIWEKGFFGIIRKNFLGPTRRWIRDTFKFQVCRVYAWRKIPVPVKMRTFYLRMTYRNFSKKYSPNKYDGDILLFRATENLYSYMSMGWELLSNNVKTVELGGKHLDIFEGKEKIELLQTEIEKHLAYANELK